MICRKFYLLIVTIAFSWFSVHGQESSQAISSNEAQKQYYAIEINNVLCGFSEEEITYFKKGGKEFIKIVSNATILQTVLGGDAHIKVESEKLIDPQTGSFVRIVSIINQGDVQFGAILNVDSLSVNHKNTLTGESKLIPITGDLILDNGSFYTFLINGINNNSLDKEYRVLETMRGEIETRSYKMIGREKISLNGKGYNSIKFSELNKGTGASGELWIEEGTGYVLQRDFSMGRKIYLTDSLVTKKIQAAKMDDITFVKVDKVISDVGNISYLKVKAEIRSTGEWITPESLNYKGQAFTGTVIDNLINGIFEISQEHYEGKAAPAFPYDYSNDENLKKYLEPDDFIESNDPVLISKAKEITSGAKNSWEAARLLSNWVASNISYAIPGGITARKTFDTRNGECGAHSRLLAAFCRGVGIPAKVVIGCMYSNTYGGTFGQHAWNEVYMGHVGWIPVDATAFEIDYIDSGHIRLGERTSFNPVEMEILEYETSTTENEELVVPEEYQKYIGKYSGPQSGKAFEVLYSDGGLAVDIPDQIQIALNHPDENGMWYAKITKQLCFSFEFDSLGQSKNMHLHELTPLPKTSSPDSIDAAVPDEFRPYLGQYYFGAIQDKLTIIYSDGTLAIKGLTVEKAIRLQAPDKDGKWMDEFNHNGIIFMFSDEGKINRLVVCTELVLPRE